MDVSQTDGFRSRVWPMTAREVKGYPSVRPRVQRRSHVFICLHLECLIFMPLVFYDIHLTRVYFNQSIYEHLAVDFPRVPVYII